MSADKEYDQYEDEEVMSKFGRKTRESPMVVVGIGGLIGACTYGAYRWRTKGPLVSTSAFLMQLRVAAQGTFIGCVMIGMVAQLIKEQFFKEEKQLDTSKMHRR